MSIKEIKIIDCICDKCKTQYQITESRYKSRLKRGTPNYCEKCMKEYMNEKRRKYFDSLSDEEKAEYISKCNWYMRLTDEEKKAHSQRTKDQLARRTPEEQSEINKKNSEGLKRHWKTQSRSDRISRTAPMQKAAKEKLKSMTAEEKHAKAIKWLSSLSSERREEVRRENSEKMKAYNKSIPMEEKIKRTEAMQKWHDNLTPEEKRLFYERTHKWYHDLSTEGKIEYAGARQTWYNNLSEEEKKAINKKALSAGKENNFSKRFYTMFYNSHLSNSFRLQREVFMSNNGYSHSWDYGVFDENGDLVMLVDLDGGFYHADSCDYDGMHSKEEYDECRSLSVPSGIMHIIIQEGNVNKCFELMMKMLMADYDKYVDEMFKYFRAMPFPSPRYTDKELIKSYSNLCKMVADDKYHGNVSLNTRLGDRIIQHFHPSIYRAKCNGCISPYNAWYNDDMLRKCIQNRTIYQNYLNPNKILQGFNISRVASKVSVFSAGRAKIIINRYLSEYSEVFDPFSGFSGRLLGSLSLNKRYVGQDISEIHVNESNNIIRFLHQEKNASIVCKDILSSYGTYQCLFTCPPYSDKEQWLDVPVDRRTCDDWIDICLEHFNCKRYVFVVDETIKYKDNIKDVIANRSYLNLNEEYVVVIDR